MILKLKPGKSERVVFNRTTYVITTKRGKLLPEECCDNGVIVSTLKRYIVEGKVPCRVRNAYGEATTTYYPISECVITKCFVRTVETKELEVVDFNKSDWDVPGHKK